jgi:FAD/FMN-containing dehydrogenase
MSMQSPPRIKSETTRVLPVKQITGWGRLTPLSGQVARPEKMSAFRDAIDNWHQEKLIARGAGRSYGDAACNPAGITILTERLDRVLGFDYESGLLRVEAGITLADLLRIFVPRGWLPPVLPGTKFVSIGGAVSSDIHGKNHHRDGSFSRHVTEFELVDGLGVPHTCSRSSEPDVFWATLGGMGLTGLITDVQLQMQKIPTAFIRAQGIKAANLNDLMDLFQEHEQNHAYSVAWIDCLSAGSRLGRGVLFLGDIAQPDELPRSISPFATKRENTFRVPLDSPDALLNTFTMSVFNESFYNLQKISPRFVHLNQFFFPLDFIHDWNRLYGKRGFAQYQCLLPPQTSQSGIRELLGLCARRGLGSFLAVLKRFGDAEAHPEASLSFPAPGYTLTLDFAMFNGLADFIAELDRVVVSNGGRVYLAKDAFLTAETFRSMYPSVGDWRKARRKLDPHGVFHSMLSERLEL